MVLVIIGIIAAVATLSLNVLGRDNEIENQTQRLAEIISQAKEEAELQGREIGVFIDRTGYQFFRFDALKQSWLAIADDDLYAVRQLPDGLSFRLWMEGREVILPQHSEPQATADTSNDTEESDSSKNETDSPHPQIMLLSSGDINAFELRVERDGTDHVWRIASQTDNSLLTEEVDHAL